MLLQFELFAGVVLHNNRILLITMCFVTHFCLSVFISKISEFQIKTFDLTQQCDS